MLSITYPWIFLLLPLPLLILYLAPAYREPRLAVRVPFMDRLYRVTGRAGGTGGALVRRTRMQKAQIAFACSRCSALGSRIGSVTSSGESSSTAATSDW